MKRTDYSLLPKVELHLHLDCCLSFEVVNKIDPTISFETYRESFVAPPKCTDLADYITRAVSGCNLMQTKEQLRLVTLDLFEQLKKEYVIYAEIRFAPLLHTFKGLSSVEVVEVVNEAVSEGISQTGVEAGLILCTLRHFSEQQSMETVNLVKEFEGSNVIGFDIAADEAGFPIDNHLKAFVFAKENKLHITAHAGEAKGAESVWETLQHFHPTRIGHGVRSVEDPKLMEFLKQNDIHLEVCPTSNVQTNVVESIEHHPVDKIYQSGVSMSINTDARTISDVDLKHEYELLENQFNWQKEYFKQCNLEAIKHAFISSEKKRTLAKKIEEMWVEINY
ncbi:Adenosine deaminase [Emticicia oligotrophica DSM 17448]|uniref:adenosine deaminase n=1 Tax=Emticicia oligotrophica (strain DSM 17448 / CIP 109782 / MTCC 6937 / GPTSA100-15) TaxID=929562 RepID=A0ABN4AIQ6_EMTOG|nr:adenosine deaminase [Emticicia oligotrophica]AFK01952.1 Adenosine deaminase [Emticicia oligotrophica DSM 17448]